MKKHEVQARIVEIGIVPCVRVTHLEHAIFAAETLYAAAIPIVEIPLTLPEAPQAIETLAKRFPNLAVGAGTVLDEESARRCIDAGARFLSSPGLIPEVVAYAVKSGMLVIPGALTPTEILAAWKAGADFVKIFPAAPVGGALYVKALKVPLPHIPLLVSGGVNQRTAFDYIRAGANAIGVGGELLPREALLHRQTHRIQELARRFLNLVKEARLERDSR